MDFLPFVNQGRVRFGEVFPEIKNEEKISLNPTNGGRQSIYYIEKLKIIFTSASYSLNTLAHQAKLVLLNFVIPRRAMEYGNTRVSCLYYEIPWQTQFA